MKKLLFIVNPKAGKTKSNAPLFDAVAAFSRAGYLVRVFLTEAGGEARIYAAKWGPQYDVVVCAGGDGTFNEVVAGMLLSGADKPIGYIPAGSTNDFASSLGLPKQIMEAARCIVEGTPHRLDIGRFNDRYFSYVASCGAFTRTSYATPQSVKNALGHVAYLLAGIKDIANIRKIHLRVETDDQVLEDDYIFGAVSNSTSVGGVLTLDPHLVNMSDGVFEVLLIRSPSNLLELNECIVALSTQNYNSGAITFCNTKKVKITAPASVDWTLDGEMAEGSETIEVENLHNAIAIICKEDTALRGK